MADVTPPGPLLTAHLFPTLDAQLVDLLRSLAPADWQRQTIAPGWAIKDVAAHLLDTQLRTLSFGRDRVTPPPPLASDGDLVSFIDRLNGEGVTVYRRLSAPVLIALIELASREAAAYYASLDPFAPARFGVSWAGESASANWFDLARELTERWHHQQQIRLALGDPAGTARHQSTNAARTLSAIMTPLLYHPVLDCFMRALPFHYRSLPAPPGTAIRIHVSGDCGGDWHLYRGDAWMLAGEAVGTIVATITIPQDIAWRIFTKGIAREHAREQVRVTGDPALSGHVLDMVAIVG
jgi:uncharacterized protein (TIGR03083 family)